MILPEYFTDHELSCKCGCGKLPDQKSVEMLYALRILKGSPIYVNSGARCVDHNQAVGGSDMSTHLVGAFDIDVSPKDEWEFIRLAQICGFTGIGFQDNQFIHIDRHHTKPVIWGY